METKTAGEKLNELIEELTVDPIRLILNMLEEQGETFCYNSSKGYKAIEINKAKEDRIAITIAIISKKDDLNYYKVVNGEIVKTIKIKELEAIKEIFNEIEEMEGE